jgi:hypothetical protein
MTGPTHHSTDEKPNRHEDGDQYPCFVSSRLIQEDQRVHKAVAEDIMISYSDRKKSH